VPVYGVVCDVRRSLVAREGEVLVPAYGQVYGLVASVPDLCKLFEDLLGEESKMLGREMKDKFFEGQFGQGSATLASFREDPENYTASAGTPACMKEVPANRSLGASVVEGELPLSGMPEGTLTWNRMPNFIWAMQKEKRLRMVFETQLLPVDNEKAVDLAMEFFRGLGGGLVEGRTFEQLPT
jgi:hypothetical protein